MKRANKLKDNVDHETQLWLVGYTWHELKKYLSL